MYDGIIFFINDAISLVDPYLMTYGFLFYGGLLGYYIYDSKINTEKIKDNIKSLLVALISFLYLLLLIWFNFFSLIIKSNLEIFYIQEEVGDKCISNLSNDDNLIKNQSLLPWLDDFKTLYGDSIYKNNDYLNIYGKLLKYYQINEIEFYNSRNCININKNNISNISGIVDIIYMNKSYISLDDVNKKIDEKEKYIKNNIINLNSIK